MLSRLIGCAVRRTMVLPSRTLRVTAAVRGGGGHDHHGPLPVHIPQPGPWERTWFGEGKAARVTETIPYVPSASCYTSYIGAGVFVALTILAIAYKTDAFKKDKGHHHAAPVKQAVKEEPVHHEPEPVVAPVEPEPVKEEVEEKPVETVVAQEEKVEETPAEEAAPKNDPPAQEEKHDESPVAVVEKETPAESDVEAPAVEKVPEFVEYLLVGAGAASYYAALAIRAKHADAKVLMVGDEAHRPYNRPPLSKEMWWYEGSRKSLTYKALSGKKRDVYFEAPGFFVPTGELEKAVHGGVALAKGRRVTRICTEEKKAFLDDGTVIGFGKCLLATGGKPKSLPELESVSDDVKQKIVYLRGVDDYRKLDQLCSEAKSVTIIGGGFLGSELAYGIKRKYENLAVNQVVRESGNLGGILPEYLAKKATESLRKFGVNVITESKVVSAVGSDSQLEVKVAGGKEKALKTDYVVVAAGIEPDTAVAESSGLEVDPKVGGVLADAQLRVAPSVYAAGDACSFFDRSLGRRRVEHWEHAQISGRLAGENMTGEEKAFWYQPSFFTKLSPEYHINAVGRTDSSLKTVSVFANDDNGKGYDRGVIFYQNEDQKVVGVLMVNVFGPSIDVSRRLIEDSRPVKDFRELAKLFPLYELPKEEAEPKEQ